MYKIQTLNKISGKGLELLSRENYEYASEIPNPDGILVRSFKMHQMELPTSLKAIARAGAGTDNIPVAKCSDKGIVVFNTPGANANSVKELTLSGLFMASRDIIGGVNWAKSLVGKGDEIPKVVEKNKSNFSGPELAGKTLGVIGLGAIGVMVANDAISLGMNVVGFDPFISIESAWGLSKNVKRARNLEALIAEADYLTLHAPLTEKTKAMLNDARFALMKRGIRILNFARGGLINNEDLLAAIKSGIVAKYVTDFVDEELLRNDKVIGIPHLAASTPEAEENCAVMAVSQLKGFLESGNIRNSINFPECHLPLLGKVRLCIANKNMPKMVSQITTFLASEKINISDMLNQHKDNLAYNIIDVDNPVTTDLIDKIGQIEGVIMVRVIK